MGWMFYGDRRVSCYADEKREITRLCTFETETRIATLLKCSKVGTTWYAAIRVAHKDGTPVETRTYETSADGSFVFAAVFLTSYHDGCWGYKDMEESAGPAKTQAPVAILNLLSAIKDPVSYAHEWRKACRDWADIPTYAEGDTIKLANPVKLTDGTTCQIVKADHYMRRGRKMRCYRVVETGTLTRLSRACLSGSELISSAAAGASPVLAEFYAKQ